MFLFKILVVLRTSKLQIMNEMLFEKELRLKIARNPKSSNKTILYLHSLNGEVAEW